ncbi:DUF6538 domain-containing protein [uncultured Methylobacterium sp.]|uniref:DUF6538 domain-containing protein n=1 Tax=uncultured Methylobacterium sp. TaxID=157278 RepID=UPI002620C37D|nr:DUF6538 domain-containing protein [uncultured Methylobacterium sp.]
MGSIANVVLRGRIFHFRRRVPDTLRPRLRLKELVRSLATTDLRAANPSLRSTTIPAIVTQVARYRATLTEQADRLAESYPTLCRDLVRLDALRRAVRAARGLAAVTTLDPLVDEVARGARLLRVDTEPRLVVFGFDADQRDGALKAVIDDLRGQHRLQVYAVGRPSGRTTAAFRPTKAA